MMIRRICWLYNKITPKQHIRLICLEGIDVRISKEDLIRADNDMLTIVRANGNVVVINPNHVIMACTIPKESLL